MNINRNKQKEYCYGLIKEMCKMPTETEWIEFKQNKVDPDEIGCNISALSNSAALEGKVKAYMIWGIDDAKHDIIGTTFKPREFKIGNEELENWLLTQFSPKIEFGFINLDIDEKKVVLVEISVAFKHPVRFKNIEYIRVGSYTKKLKDFPEKERELWRIFDKTPFEQGIAQDNVSSEDVLSFIDYPSYFSFLDMPLPDSRDKILKALKSEKMLTVSNSGKWNITNLGAILFAKELSQFSTLARKAVRVVQYKGIDKTETIREHVINKGYACGFEALIEFVKTIVPTNEVISKAIRKEVPMFPDIAIRELVANALIHQDFYISGSSPMIELFVDRIEITNPGRPLVETDRFLDSPPKSRNEGLASFMRRIGVCEERGSGVDKVIVQTALYQLPAPLFEEKTEHTIAVLFSHKEFTELNKDERIRACYWHTCLQYVNRQAMTNATLRERFGLDSSKGPQISRIITGALEAELIKKLGDSEAKSEAKYQPYWA